MSFRNIKRKIKFSSKPSALTFFMVRLCLFIAMTLLTQSSDKRLLLLFTKSAHNIQYIDQTRILKEDKAGLNERDIVVKEYVYNTSNAHLFKEQKIKSEFVIILVGKDGGEKYRSPNTVSLKYLYDLIDAMPMRKAELKEKKN